MTSDNKRENFRIHYLGKDSPIFVVGITEYRVIDLSMTGVLLQFPKTLEAPPLDDFYEGVIKFQDRTLSPVSGTVVRVDKFQMRIALVFVKMLPGAVLMEQHRHWINKMKGRKVR